MPFSDRHNRSFRRFVEADIEMLPLMNIFIVLIPMLLLSAVFVEISVHDLSLPSNSEPEDAKKPDEERLNLSVTILSDAYVIAGKSIKSKLIERDESGEADVELYDALVALVEKNPDTRDVRVVSAPTTQYQEIITVMDISRDAGLPEVALLGADLEEM